MSIPPECKSMVEHPLHKSTVTKLVYSNGGTKLACASNDTTISLVKTPVIQKLEVTSMQGHNSYVNSIVFSSCDKYLISASADKSCVVWNMQS